MDAQMHDPSSPAFQQGQAQLQALLSRSATDREFRARLLDLGLDEDDPDRVTGTEPKADLVALADARDALYPTPPSDQDEDTPDDAGEADPA